MSILKAIHDAGYALHQYNCDPDKPASWLYRGAVHVADVLDDTVLKWRNTGVTVCPIDTVKQYEKPR